MPVMQLSLAVGAYWMENGVVRTDLADLVKFTEKHEDDERLVFDPTRYHWVTCIEASDGTIEILFELSEPS